MLVRQSLQSALSMILSKGMAACRMPLWIPGCNAAAAVNTIHVIAEPHSGCAPVSFSCYSILCTHCAGRLLQTTRSAFQGTISLIHNAGSGARLVIVETLDQIDNSAYEMHYVNTMKVA